MTTVHIIKLEMTANPLKTMHFVIVQFYVVVNWERV